MVTVAMATCPATTLVLCREGLLRQWLWYFRKTHTRTHTRFVMFLVRGEIQSETVCCDPNMTWGFNVSEMNVFLIALRLVWGSSYWELMSFNPSSACWLYTHLSIHGTNDFERVSLRVMRPPALTKWKSPSCSASSREPLTIQHALLGSTCRVRTIGCSSLNIIKHGKPLFILNNAIQTCMRK